MGAHEDPFERAWRELLAHWPEDAAHRRFIAFCAAQSALVEAGKRYRVVREQDPARSEEARRRIDQVLSTALQSMELVRTDKPRHNKAVTWVAASACVFLTLYALVTLLRVRGH